MCVCVYVFVCLCTTAPGLQAAIDAAVAKYPSGRSFVRSVRVVSLSLSLSLSQGPWSSLRPVEDQTPRSLSLCVCLCLCVCVRLRPALPSTHQWQYPSDRSFVSTHSLPTHAHLPHAIFSRVAYRLIDTTPPPPTTHTHPHTLAHSHTYPYNTHTRTPYPPTHPFNHTRTQAVRY